MRKKTIFIILILTFILAIIGMIVYFSMFATYIEVGHQYDNPYNVPICDHFPYNIWYTGQFYNEVISYRVDKRSVVKNSGTKLNGEEMKELENRVISISNSSQELKNIKGYYVKYQGHIYQISQEEYDILVDIIYN